jgi:adenine-specific DNA-methyltransferase
MSKKLEEYTKEELLAYIAKLKKDTKFGLVWNPKDEQVAIDCETKVPVLKEVADRTITIADSNEPTHLLIEGDNYHSLSVLNYTHSGKVDVIYIDPPYNTGNKDFIYNDHYVDKEDPYRHSEWLSFMDNRLRLAKSLLADTGVILISIDDNEQAHLKILCDTIFGADNFVATLPTIMNLKGNQDEFGFAGTHEYVLVYTKNKSKSKFNVFNLDEEELNKDWLEDEHGIYKVADNLRATGVNAPRAKRPNLYYPIFITSDEHIYSTEDDLPKSKSDEVVLPHNPDGEELSWYWKKDTLAKNIHNLIIKRTKNGTQFYRKQRPSLGEVATKKPKSIWYKAEYSTSSATTQLKSMFGTKVFNNPKPVALIKDLLHIASDNDALVLDFMAGSGTTGQAVLELNQEYGGKRQFILGTNNENGIAENITHERIKKVINGYNSTAGIPANVRYFKTDFVDTNGLSTLTDKDKLEITKEMGGMIALRENSFEQVEQTEHWQTYKNDAQLTAIYFREDKTHIQEYLDKLNAQDKPVKLYVFGWGKNAGTEYASKKISVEDIPEPLIEVYKEIAK